MGACPTADRDELWAGGRVGWRDGVGWAAGDASIEINALPNGGLAVWNSLSKLKLRCALVVRWRVSGGMGSGVGVGGRAGSGAAKAAAPIQEPTARGEHRQGPELLV